MRKAVVLIKGGGDLASGIAHSLAKQGVGVVVTELAQPKMVRREVSFGNAVYKREVEIEGVQGVLCPTSKEAFVAIHHRKVAVLVDPTCSSLEFIRPAVLVDAVMAKRNTGTRIYDAPVVIAVGPGFEAGRDCHAVVESLRGEDLGRVLYSGAAAFPTGKPAEVEGYSTERVLRAPKAGVFRGAVKIGDSVHAGDEVARIGAAAGAGMEDAGEGIGVVSPEGSDHGMAAEEIKRRVGATQRTGTSGATVPPTGSADGSSAAVGPIPAGPYVRVVAQISGVVKGLLADGATVREGQKVGDIDPTGRREGCFRMSDKSLAVGRGVIEAIRRLAPAVLEST